MMSDADGPRLLCFSPYTYWELHGQWEAALLHGARARGADIRYVLCDGVMTECDVFWAATQPRHALACTDCQGRVGRLMASLRMSYQWLGRWTMPDDERQAVAWAEGLSVEGLTEASHGTWPLGAWVMSSVNSHFRTAPPDMANPEVVDAYRRYLASALRVALAFERLLEDARPDVLLLFNGRQAPTRVAFELASRRGVRVICHERGGRPEALMLFDGVRCDSAAMIQQVIRQWEDIPLDAVALRTIEGYMRGRAEGKGLGWIAFSKGLEEPGPLRRRLGLDDRPVWVLYTSSDDEVAASEDFRSAFRDHAEWLQRTMAWASSRADVQWVIRVHPNLGGRTSTGRNERQLAEVRALAAVAPPWVRFVMPDDDVSSYALLGLAEQVLVYHSTIGLEAGARGLPVLVAGHPVWTGAAFAAYVADATDYEDLLASRLQLGSLTPALEIRRMALRLAHAIYFRYQIGFAPVRMPDAHTGRPAWRGAEALAPGQDPGLDRIVSILVDGLPVVPVPTEADRARSMAIEDAWLAEGRFLAGAPLVSVIITCYNYAAYVGLAMESVLAQTFQDFELLVIDDGSTDESVPVAEAVAAAYPNHAIRVWSQPNSGQPAHARNAAIAQARGRYIACLDADDLLEPHFLAGCVAVLERRPEVGLVYVDLQDIGGDERRWPGVDWHPETLTRFNYIPCCTLFRKEGWERVGGYRTNVRGYEDWDFWLALAAVGYQGYRVAYPWFRYRRHASGVYHQALKTALRLVAGVRRNNPTMFSPRALREAGWWEGLDIRLDGRDPGRTPPLVVLIPLDGERPDLDVVLGELIGSLDPDLFELILLQRGPSPTLDALQEDMEGDVVILDEPASGEGGAALNRAVSVARGRWLLWLEPGTTWDLAWLNPLLAALSGSHEEVAPAPSAPPWLSREALVAAGGVPDALSWGDLKDWLGAFARRDRGGLKPVP
jgi:glycosyltransferase involved in cell wall biosynthesis